MCCWQVMLLPSAKTAVFWLHSGLFHSAHCCRSPSTQCKGLNQCVPGVVRQPFLFSTVEETWSNMVISQSRTAPRSETWMTNDLIEMSFKVTFGTIHMNWVLLAFSISLSVATLPVGNITVICVKAINTYCLMVFNCCFRCRN